MMPSGPAVTTLRSVVAHLALVVRGAGIAYTIVQVVTWHSFYTASAWRLAGPVLAVTWAAAAMLRLRRGWPSPALACLDSAVYVALALGGSGCVPPAVRDEAFSWLVISMSGQLMIPAWYAPGILFWLLALMSATAYGAGAMLHPVTSLRTLTAATIVLIVVGGVHAYGRRQLYRRAAAADAELRESDQAASAQYAILRATIERREHERLLHDTVLNTLTAVARSSRADLANAVNRCRQDVDLIEDALADPNDLATGAKRRSGDLLAEMRAAVADMRARGLRVHAGIDDGQAPAIPARVALAISSAAREALSNVAAHAGTGEAWVRVRLTAPDGDGAAPPGVAVTVRDEGAGFDRARVDHARLGLRRSIAERVADCGGRASVWSRPGNGTVVRLSWPAGSGPDPGAAEAGPQDDHALAAESLPW
jgi:signal transduction histidine kinase